MLLELRLGAAAALWSHERLSLYRYMWHFWVCKPEMYSLEWFIGVLVTVVVIGHVRFSFNSLFFWWIHLAHLGLGLGHLSISKYSFSNSLCFVVKQISCSLQGPGTGRGWTSVWLPAARHGAISTASIWAVHQGNSERRTADSDSPVRDTPDQRSGPFPEVATWHIIHWNGPKDQVRATVAFVMVLLDPVFHDLTPTPVFKYALWINTDRVGCGFPHACRNYPDCPVIGAMQHLSRVRVSCEEGRNLIVITVTDSRSMEW